MRKPNDQSIKDVIDRFLDVNRLRKKFDETFVVTMWPEIMGTAIANRTKQIYVFEKKLFVRIESSVIKNELLMVKQGIIDKLNERAGAEVVAEIVFL